MLRAVVQRVSSVTRSSVLSRAAATSALPQPAIDPHHGTDTAEAFNERYLKFFSSNIDHWEIRSAMNDLAGIDTVPEPTVICAALRACRKLNDYALTVRFLESIKEKCGDQASVIYPYIIKEIRPTLDELGINTPEELGYDKPELALQCVYDIH